ncbi:MAG TPA: dephospho-CoA kinase [Lysobacter sp.]|nr:dephospho-CoA kinase [Lysobacter sp.]
MSEYVVGLTGGIASGKSEVGRRFAALGVTVVDADVAARDALAPGSPGLADVIAHFGPAVLDASGALDRAAMRRRVFGDDAARRALEAIVHPRVREAMQRACRDADGVYAIAMIPLLAEGGGRATYPWLDRILVVDAPETVQRERLIRRDGIAADLADRMIAAQATRAARLAIADDVLVNDGRPDALVAHVEALDARYRVLANG